MSSPRDDLDEYLDGAEHPVHGPIFRCGGRWGPAQTAAWGRAQPSVSSLIYWAFEDDPQPDLTFLHDLEGLEHLSVYGAILDDRAVEGCTRLRSLGLAIPSRRKFDFTRLGRLEDLQVAPARQGRGFEDLVHLRRLNCNLLSADLGPLSRMQDLSDAHLAGRRMTSLAGVERLTSLEYLLLDSAGHLADLGGLAESRAEEVRLDNVRRLVSVDAVAGNASIRTLWIGGFASLSSVRPLCEMAGLTYLTLAGGQVEDGDLACLLTIPTLEALVLDLKGGLGNTTREEIDGVMRSRESGVQT